MKQTIFILLVFLGTISAQQKAISLNYSTLGYRHYDLTLERFLSIGIYVSSHNTYNEFESINDSTVETRFYKTYRTSLSPTVGMGRLIFPKKPSENKQKWKIFIIHRFSLSPNYKFSSQNKYKTTSYQVRLSFSSLLEIDYRITEQISFFNQIGVLFISASARRDNTKSSNGSVNKRWYYDLNAQIGASQVSLVSVGLIYFLGKS